MTMPRTIDDLTPDPKNPRRITRKSARALGKSLKTFGDVAGITYNVTTGQLVAGHQRVKDLTAKGGRLEIRELESPPDGIDDVQAVIVFPNGDDEFPVRLVEWDEAKQALANLSANNPLISGEYTGAVTDIIEGLHAEHGDLVDGLRLDDLGDLYSGKTKPPVEHERVALIDGPVVVELGDEWGLGPHRVACADSAVEKNRGALLIPVDGSPFLLTDPPYGINYDPQAMFVHGDDHPAPKAAAGMQGDDRLPDGSFGISTQGSPESRSATRLRWRPQRYGRDSRSSDACGADTTARVARSEGLTLLRSQWGSLPRRSIGTPNRARRCLTRSSDRVRRSWRARPSGVYAMAWISSPHSCNSRS